ncbi:MAG TPA: VWA domain-containing protein [Planctomycetota bacterium]|nr:VWA domain-containing protein [Planctomycetota bacterium]
MEFRYTRFDPELARLEELLHKLERIFNELLLLTDGDVEASLAHLDRIGKRYGWFHPKFTIEDFRRWLERRGIVRVEGGVAGARPALGARGERSLRNQALETIFEGLRPDVQGEHRTRAPGDGGERTSETRPWQFGDSTNAIDFNASFRNAFARSGSFRLGEDDLEVFETEHNTSCATVLLVDISHSMVLYGEDRITPAKRVALALCELIKSRYPKDSLHVVLFGDDAWEVAVADLPYIGAGPYHTNTREGLRRAREILRRAKSANKQILMITDGKPSALTEPDGTIYKNSMGLDRRVVNKTLEEAGQCRRLGIPITTFMLTEDPSLVDFVERFTAENHGRAFYSSASDISSFVLVDYVRNRRRRS